MLADDMYELQMYLRDQGILFCYCGYMTEDTLVGIGDAIKKKMAIDNADKKTTRSVFAIFVEQVQNVIRYSTEREGGAGHGEISYGLLVVGFRGDDVFVTCGNMVSLTDVERLERSLSKIQRMDREDLKTLWKKTLREEAPEGSKGAGVGFIDIALKAQKGIEFGFKPLDGDSAFFTLKAYI